MRARVSAKPLPPIDPHRVVGNHEPMPGFHTPIIVSGRQDCPTCGGKLIYTGWDKIMYPKLEVMNCDACRVSWWRETTGRSP
jgi:hypothetical protein